MSEADGIVHDNLNPTGPTVSEQFCSGDSDITLRSSDNVLFKVHRKNLEMHSNIFADAGMVSLASSEVVSLTETSEVLEMFLKFMYRHHEPDLEQLDFDLLSRVAEAAEKYALTSVTRYCKLCMRLAISEHALEVLAYATKHDYADLADKAAVLVLDIPLDRILVSFTSAYLRGIWMRYHAAWLGALDKAHETLPHHSHQCQLEGWEQVAIGVSSTLGGKPAVLTRLASVFELEDERWRGCWKCSDGWRSWCEGVQKETDRLPKFSSLL